MTLAESQRHRQSLLRVKLRDLQSQGHRAGCTYTVVGVSPQGAHLWRAPVREGGSRAKLLPRPRPGGARAPPAHTEPACAPRGQHGALPPATEEGLRHVPRLVTISHLAPFVVKRKPRPGPILRDTNV